MLSYVEEEGENTCQEVNDRKIMSESQKIEL